MRSNRRYLVAVALLVILAVVFGLAGTVAPPLAEEAMPEAQQELSADSSSSSSSIGHFQNPPTYDSGWVDITDKCGQYISLKHNLNTTNVFVDVTGKQSLGPMGVLAWNKTYGGTFDDDAHSLVQTTDGGYALAGYTYRIFPINYDFLLVKTDSAGNIQWSKTYGGASNEIAYSVVQTGDGGYALAGYTNSYGAGDADFYLVKTDSAGTKQWSRTYGGANGELARSVIQTVDGGYALAGYTYSFGVGTPTYSNAWLVRTDGSGNQQWSQAYGGASDEVAYSVVQTAVSGYALAGYTTSVGAGNQDAWLVRTDASGTVQWSQPYGGANNDCAYSVVQTGDGGYVLAGYTDSYGAGSYDFYMVKTDASGNMKWSKTYGGADFDVGMSLAKTVDGGYAIGGGTNSSYGAGISDFWLVKTDSAGNIQWSKPFGGPRDDYAWCLVQTGDGGYVLAGYTDSYGAGSYDFYLVKVSVVSMGGALAWSKSYDESNSDVAYSVVQTSDGGYALAGYTTRAGVKNFWLVKTDSDGKMLWSQSYGGAGEDVARSVIQTSDGGYAIAGQTDSYGSGLLDFWLVKTDAYGNHLWNKTYGGADIEIASSVVQTSDGGYALAGDSSSYGAGNGDFWLVKTDAYGTMQWSRTYGGASSDQASSMVQTSDGGYALAGHTYSAGAGGYNMWLVKTNSTGSMLWSQPYGGAGADYALSLVQTYDSGYALAGYTDSYGAGSQDFWLVKTDAYGNHLWNKTYGGASEDHAYSLVQTTDGGYALAGDTYSFGAGYYDFWLVKTDSAGALQWSKNYEGPSSDHNSAYSLVQIAGGGYALAGTAYSHEWLHGWDFWLVRVKPEMNTEHQRNIGGTGIHAGWSKTYGGAINDAAFSIVRTSDGGYALAGPTSSYGAGQADFWLVKTDSCGCIELLRTYGGTLYDYAESVIQTADGGYALAGWTESYGAGSYDFWLVKTDSAGTVQWTKTYGGTSWEVAYSLVQTADGGYALAGYTNSFGAGGDDFWLVKTDSAGNMLWSRTYGGASSEVAFSLVQTGDGGYALAGYTDSVGAGFNDFWLVKTDASGTVQWSRTYGGTGTDSGYSLVQTSDCSGYALVGRTNSFGAGGDDFWLVKTDSAGNMLWSRTYGGAGDDVAYSLVQTSDCGYALAGYTSSFGAGGDDFWLVKTDSLGTVQWTKTYGRAGSDVAKSLVQTGDGGYALAGYTDSVGAGFNDFWLVKTDVEMGLARTGLTQNSITLYRGKTDLDWNYVRVRIWTIKEPSWIYGDINMDGIVDNKDLYIIGRNYGKTFSLISLGGIAAIAGVRTYKKRKRNS